MKDKFERFEIKYLKTRRFQKKTLNIVRIWKKRKILFKKIKNHQI